MPRRLRLAVQTFKQKLSKTPEKCKEAWNVYSKQRGIAVCEAIHNIFAIVTTVGALPYGVEKLDNGYRKLIPVQGLKKWIVTGIYTYMVFRPLSFLLLLFSSKLQMTVGGNFTADCLIWVLNVQITLVPAIFCYKFGRNPTDVAMVYNGLGEINRAVLRKYFKGKHIFELANIHWAVVLLIVSARTVMAFSLILSVGVFLPLKDTPVFLAYQVSGPYIEIHENDVFRIVLYWICSLVQWLSLNYMLWVIIMLMLLMGEGFIGVTLLLKNIRNLSPEEISWREKHEIHAQLEIISRYTITGWDQQLL